MLSRNFSGVPKSLILLLSVGLARTEKQLMASKLSSYLRDESKLRSSSLHTVPAFALLLLGLSPQLGAGELLQLLLARVPLAGQQHGEAVSCVRDLARRVGDLPEHVGRVAEGSHRGGNARQQSSGSGQRAQGGATALRACDTQGIGPMPETVVLIQTV